MQLRLDPRRGETYESELARALSGAHGVCAVSGDDPLLLSEAVDALRRVLKRLGFTERETETTDRSFPWASWVAQASMGSLFAEQKLIELRLPTGKPGVEGAKAIQGWVNAPPGGRFLLLHLPRLDGPGQKSAWVQAIVSQSLLVIVPDLPAADMPAWIQARLARQNLTATPEAIRWLAQQCEGNLTAAHQEILKLGALPRSQPQRPIDLGEMQAVSSDHARFNPFSLGEVLTSGDARRSLRVIRTLREEGEPLPLLIWSAAQACRRLPPRRAGPALQALSRIDTMVKGLAYGQDPWMALERLALTLAQPQGTR